jgi:hypothetical protein
MRIIKLGIISVIFFSLLITGISLFFPSHIRISKAIDISTEKNLLMNHLGDVSKWKLWYPGADTSSFLYVGGKINGITAANGQALMIKEINDSTVQTMNLRPNSKNGTSGWNVFSGRNPGSYTVQWYMDFHLRWYPWEKFSSLLLEKRYGAMMEHGLNNLKALLEK